nr:hypothetical protein Iba_chr04eCG19020 [Ipomoea batatas]
MPPPSTERRKIGGLRLLERRCRAESGRWREAEEEGPPASPAFSASSTRNGEKNAITGSPYCSLRGGRRRRWRSTARSSASTVVVAAVGILQCSCSGKAAGSRWFAATGYHALLRRRWSCLETPHKGAKVAGKLSFAKGAAVLRCR